MSDEEQAVRARIEGVVGRSLAAHRRADRWIAGGDGAAGVVVHVAADARAEARLRAEGALYRRWRAAGIPAPRVLAERDGVQVREWLPGLGGDGVEPKIFGGPPPADRLRDDVPCTPFGLRLARAYGELAARVADAVPLEDPLVAALGTSAFDGDAALRHLAATDADLARRLAPALAWLEDVGPADAVVHGDLHFHNLCVSREGPDAGAITGVFDAGDAGPDTRWRDLQYVHSLGPRFVAAALEAYAAGSGRAVDREAVERAHLRVALGHLVHFPAGAARHPSIVAWVRTLVPLLPA